MSQHQVEAVLSARDLGFSRAFSAAERQMANFDKMSANMVKGYTAGFKNIAGMATKYMGIAATGIGGFSIKVGADFEAGMSEVMAISGATEEELKDLTQAAREMGKTTKFSATESAEALKYMGMAGWKSAEMLDALPGVMYLAAASGEELGLVSDIVTDSMTAFSYSADQASHFADVLARTSTSSNTNVAMMGESFKYVASSAGALNYTIEDTGLVLGAMANAGIKSSTAGTSLRATLQALKAPSDETLSAMNDLGLSFYDSEGKAKPLRDVMNQLRGATKGMTDQQREATMSMLFGTRAAEGMSAVLQVSEDDWNDLAFEIDNSTGAAKEMHDIMNDNLKGDLTKLRSAAEGFGEAAFRAFGDLRPIVQSVTGLVGKATDLIEKLNAEGNTTADKFQIIANAAKPLAPLFAAIGAATGLVIFGPGISALSTGVTNLGNKLPAAAKNIKVFGSNTINSMQQIASSAGSTIKVLPQRFATIGGKLPKAFQGAWTEIYYGLNTSQVKISKWSSELGVAIKEKTDIIPKSFKNAFGKVGGAVQSGMKTGMNTGVSLLNKSLGTMRLLVQTALSAIGPAAIVGVGLAGLGLLYSKFGDQIDGVLNMAKEKGPGIIQGLVQGITSRLPDLINSGTQMVTGIAGVITANLPAIIQGGVDIIRGLVQGVGNNAGELIGVAIDVIGSLVEGILNAVPQLIMVGMELLLSLANGIVSNIPKIVETVTTLIQTFTGNIGTYLPQIISTGVEILLALINGLVTMIPQLIPVIVSAVSTMIGALSENLPRILQGGIAVVMALVQGIINNLPQIARGAAQIITSLFNGLVTNLPTILSAGLQLILQLLTAIVTGLPSIVSAGWEIIKSLASGILNAIPNILTGVWNAVTGFFSNLWKKITGTSDEGADGVIEAIDKTKTGVERGTDSAADRAIANSERMAKETESNYYQAASAATKHTATASENVTKELEGMSSESSLILEQFKSDSSSAFSILETESTSSAISMASNVAGQYNQLQSNVANSMTGVQTGVQNNMRGTSQVMTSEMNKMTQVSSAGLQKTEAAYKKFGQSIKTSIEVAMRAISSATGKAMAEVAQQAQSGAQKTVSTFNGARAGTQQAGYNAGMGFYYGLSSTAGSIYALASSIAYNVAATMRRALQTRSPSKVTTKIGDDTGSGVVVGMGGQIKNILSVAKQMATAAIPKINTNAISDTMADIKARTSAGIDLHYNQEINTERQPAYFNLNLGGREYRGFAQDIHDTNEATVQLELAYT